MADRMKEKLGVSTLTASLALGAVLGFCIESHTDDVARGKMETVRVCRVASEIGETVTQDFVDCTRAGVPNGRKIGSKPFHEGDSSALVDSYVRAQADEQGIEPTRIVGWSILGGALSVADWIF